MYLLYKIIEQLILLSHRVQCDSWPQNFNKYLNISIYMYLCLFYIISKVRYIEIITL